MNGLLLNYLYLLPVPASCCFCAAAFAFPFACLASALPRWLPAGSDAVDKTGTQKEKELLHTVLWCAIKRPDYCLYLILMMMSSVGTLLNRHFCASSLGVTVAFISMALIILSFAWVFLA